MIGDIPHIPCGSLEACSYLVCHTFLSPRRQNLSNAVHSGPLPRDGTRLQVCMPDHDSRIKRARLADTQRECIFGLNLAFLGAWPRRMQMTPVAVTSSPVFLAHADHYAWLFAPRRDSRRPACIHIYFSCFCYNHCHPSMAWLRPTS